MSTIKTDAQKGAHHAVANVGPFHELDQYEFQVGPYSFSGKVFLKDALDLAGMEVSIGKMPPGSMVPYSHKHKENEELYLFIKGTGEFLIDGEVVPVTEGTMIRVSPEGVRAWRNNSTEELYYIVIQAKDNSLGQFTLTDGIIVDPKLQWP